MADGPYLGFWGTPWRERGAGYDGKAAEAPPVAAPEGPYLGLWGTLWRERGDGYDGKAAEEPPVGLDRVPVNPMAVTAGRMMSRS